MSRGACRKVTQFNTTVPLLPIQKHSSLLCFLHCPKGSKEIFFLQYLVVIGELTHITHHIVPFCSVMRYKESKKPGEVFAVDTYKVTGLGYGTDP